MSDGLQKLVEKAQGDRTFLRQLLSNPEDVIKDFNLSSDERSAILGNSPNRLQGLADSGLLRAGCGSSGTCESTCTATCTVTFTSIVGADQVINPA